MATFHGQTVDIYEDFEDATLEAGLTKVDASSHMTLPDSSWRANSMSIDLSGAVGSWTAVIELSVSSLANMSFGIWCREPNYSTNGHYNYLLRCRTSAWARAFHITTARDFAGNCYIGINLEDGGVYGTQGIQVSPDTDYWVTCRWRAGTGADLSVYDSTYNLIGSITGIASNANNIDVVVLGESYHFQENIGLYTRVDDYVIDGTAALFPVLGWDVGGVTGTSIYLRPGAANPADIILRDPTQADSTTKDLTGSIAAVATLTAELTVTTSGGTVDLDGVIAATSTLSAELALTKPLAGSIDAASTISATLAVTKPLTGSIDATSTLTATLAVTKPLTGSIDAASTLTATLSLTKPLAGVIASTSTLMAELSAAGNLLLSVTQDQALQTEQAWLDVLIGTAPSPGVFSTAPLAPKTKKKARVRTGLTFPKEWTQGDGQQPVTIPTPDTPKVRTPLSIHQAQRRPQVERSFMPRGKTKVRTNMSIAQVQGTQDTSTWQPFVFTPGVNIDSIDAWIGRPGERTKVH